MAFQTKCHEEKSFITTRSSFILIMIHKHTKVGNFSFSGKKKTETLFLPTTSLTQPINIQKMMMYGELVLFLNLLNYLLYPRI